MFHIILIDPVLNAITFLAHSFSYKSRNIFILTELALACYPVSFTALIFGFKSCFSNLFQTHARLSHSQRFYPVTH